MGDRDEASPSDAELMRAGRELSGAYAVSVRCSSCGAHGPPAMPDGVRHLMAHAYSVGYRMRELGREGLVEWMGRVDPGRPVARSPDLASPILGEEGVARDRDDRADRACELGLNEGRHAYASRDGRRWACPCGSWVVGTRVVFAWPGSPLDGQAHVVTDAQLEELGRAGLTGAQAVLDAVRPLAKWS